MTGRLAVLTPYIGLPSETFVRRHVEDLLPGRTAVVSTTLNSGIAPTWSVPSPHHLILEHRDRKPRRGLIAKLPGRRTDPRGFVPAGSSVQALRTWLREQDVAVALGEYLDVWLPLVETFASEGVSFFGHAHGYDISVRLRDQFWRDQYRRYRSASGVIVVSNLAKARLIDLGLDDSRVHVVPCGVDVPTAIPLRPPSHITTFIAAGRMVAKKGPLHTVRAFTALRKRGISAKLVMVGDGPLFPEVAEHVRECGVAEDVRLLGTLEHHRVLDLMRSADVFVQHSLSDPVSGDEEGLPVALLEAMAAGLPVISTRHAGIPEAVLDGVTGNLVDEGDIDAMSDAMQRLATGTAQRALMGAAGWERAAQLFSWPTEKAALLDLFELAV